MNNIYQHYIIDLSSNNNFVQIPAMQGDGNSVRGFEIELIQNGIPYIIDREDTLISIMGTKPDTSQIMNPCGLTEEGYILVDITSQMTAVKGRGDYQIVLFGKSTNSQLKSFPFYLLTAPAAFDIDHITSSDEFQALTRNITRTESVIGDADQAIFDVRELEASVEAKEASRVRAEEARVQAEGRREEAEDTRTASENIRKENEDSRKAAEIDRQGAEVSRVKAETSRELNEGNRNTNEEVRKENEADREKAEAAREASEDVRNEAEAGRTAAENDRVKEEAVREEAETIRNASEAERTEAENIRKANETARRDSETVRQAQEADRQEEESTRQERESTRQEAEAARETAETGRVQSEGGRASAEEIRRENETLRIENETSRQEAEDSRNSAEEARETAEAQRKTAEEARVLQEAARQENETFRQENEASRQEKLAAAVSHAQSAADRAEKAAETADESAESALEAKDASLQSALKAKSYAHGGTGTREGEDTDNADFYYQQSKALHEDILAAKEATEENAGLMSAHDKSWLNGKFKRYVYGEDSPSESFNGYYKIASVETSTAHRTFGVALRIWTCNFTNYATAPMNMTIYFRTNNDSKPSTVVVYADIHGTGSGLYADQLIYIKHTNNPDLSVPNGSEKCEIYFNRYHSYGKIVVDVLGEVSIESDSSKENYRNVWTFYDGSEVVDEIEEEGYEVKSPIYYAAKAYSNAGDESTPIFLENGILKPCTDLPTGGTTDYNDLENIPTINGTAVSGAKSPEDFNLVKYTTTRDLGIDNTNNAIGYVVGANSIYGISDGSLFQQSYSANWSQQIYGDYRTGQIATRGKNNGVWQSWRRQVDHLNYKTLIPNMAEHVRWGTTDPAAVSENKYIKIEIESTVKWMLAFTIRIYQNYLASDILISFYNYLGSSTPILRPQAEMIGSNYDGEYHVDITFGYDANGKKWIIFPRYDYTGVSIYGITNGFQQVQNLEGLFTIKETVGIPEGTQVFTKRCYRPVRNDQNGEIQLSNARLGGALRVGNKMRISGGEVYLFYDYDNPSNSGYITMNEGFFSSGGGLSYYGYTAIKSPHEAAFLYYGKNSYDSSNAVWTNYSSTTLGRSSERWGQIYTTTAVNVSSDSREKIDQKLLDDELTEKFVLGLTPKSYKRIDGTSGRRHHGLIAQEIEELMEKLGISSLDFAGFIKSPKEIDVKEVNEEGEEVLKTEVVEGEYVYSLRYEEFLPMLVKMIQIQHDKIKALEEEYLQLSDRLSRVERYSACAVERSEEHQT